MAASSFAFISMGIYFLCLSNWRSFSFREKNSQISILSSHHKLIMLSLNKEESMQNIRYLFWERASFMPFMKSINGKSLIPMLCIINSLLHAIICFPMVEVILNTISLTCRSQQCGSFILSKWKIFTSKKYVLLLKLDTKYITGNSEMQVAPRKWLL